MSLIEVSHSYPMTALYSAKEVKKMQNKIYDVVLPLGYVKTFGDNCEIMATLTSAVIKLKVNKIYSYMKVHELKGKFAQSGGIEGTREKINNLIHQHNCYLAELTEISIAYDDVLGEKVHEVNSYESIGLTMLHCASMIRQLEKLT